jgi:Icc-related predicted phosphoesterase
MRIVLISDTHEKHEKLIVPMGDVLIHAGDFTNLGEEKHIVAFNKWFVSQPHPWKVLIAGNHDRLFETNPAYAQSFLDLNQIIYLEDSFAQVGDLKIYGSPWTPRYHSDYWKFHKKPCDMRNLWKKIPEGLDILITHGPPYGCMDFFKEHAGCSELAERLRHMEQPPKIHVFGHIHEGYGFDVQSGTTYYNAASVGMVNGYYDIKNKPFVLDWYKYGWARIA